MNAGIVLSFHGSLESILEKTGGDTKRVSEFLLFEKFSKGFGRVFLFSHDSKDYSQMLPENFVQVKLRNRFFYLAFGWIAVLLYTLRYGIKAIYAECGPALPPLFMVNKATGAKVVLNYDNTWFLSAYGLKRRLLKALERFLLNFVDYFVIASTEIAGFVGKRKGILPLKKGIVMEEFNPGKVRESAIYGKIKGKVLVFTGRLHAVKDPVTLVKAHKIAKDRVGNLHLIMAGEGVLRKECESIADKNVHFIGFVDDVPGLLKGADVFVLSSVYDASPRSLMEAMAMGLPSISTRVGGVPDYLDESTGILIEPGNPNVLAEKIVYLLKNPEIAAGMGKKARGKMMKYHDLGRNLDWLVKFLKEEGR
jgi:glycosyltransferase involved in cell wall biosynthesis